VWKIFRFALPGRKKGARTAPPSTPQNESAELLAA
jgi:hypothetical protein